MKQVDRINGVKAKLLNTVEKCPYCHKSIDPTPLSSIGSDLETILQVMMQCTSCNKAFIAVYRVSQQTKNQYLFQEIYHPTLETREFSSEVVLLSSDFVHIYNQAFTAEQSNLTEISGMGYRKALEFLIKDFLISLNQNKEEEIKAKMLGRCINDEIENSRIKDMAKRATWLGNDETHYVRKWEDKDLSDLKRLIDVVTHFIEMEVISQAYLKDMPAK